MPRCCSIPKNGVPRTSSRRRRHPRKPPTLNTVIRLIAGLGGFLGRKSDGEPGMKTIRLGLQRVRHFTEGMRFANELQVT
jgi:hypothetical protein